MKTFYTITTKSNGDIAVPFNTTDGPNNWERGGTASFRFSLPQFTDTLTVSDSYTVSGVESYSDVTIQSGGTLDIPSGTVLQTGTYTNNGTVNQDGTLTIHSEIADTLSHYVEWAGSWNTLEMMNHRVKYHTLLGDAAEVESLLWGIEPNGELAAENVVGVWGLVENIENEQNHALTRDEYRIDVTVLAPLDDYENLNAVETDLII